MNRKISGAKLVLVPITQEGRNYFPFVEDLKDRYIKFIDFFQESYLPDTADPGLSGYSEGTLYMTLTNKIGNLLLFNHAPIEMFDVLQTRGIRQAVGAKLSLQNCFIECLDPALVGKTVALMFYYDLPEFSSRSHTKNLITDSASVEITTATYYNMFPDVERMSGKLFRKIQFLPTTTTPEGETGLNTTDLFKLYVTLRKGSYNVVENMPLYAFWQPFFYESLEFANIVFDFVSSYITVGGAGSQTSVVGKYAFFNLTYEM